LVRADEFLSPFSIINRYAKFGSMSTYRWELVIEGSNDLQEWKEYGFKYKPGFTDKAPAVIPFHLPGLDWRIWFLPSSVRHYGSSALPNWYFSFLDALLEGRKEVLKLLDHNPFPHFPPKYVRTVMYDYTFTDYKSRWKNEDEVSDRVKENLTTQWWKREFKGVVGNPRSLPKASN